VDVEALQEGAGVRPHAVERELTIEANESTFIPAGNRHRLENATALPLVIIEVQSGPYLGEDDIVRFDDRYQRN